MAFTTWVYERGAWTEIRAPLAEGSTEYGDALQEMGLYRHESLRFGDEHGFHMDVHEADDPLSVEGPEGQMRVEFLAIVGTPFRFYPVFVADLPSLVQIIGELRPMIASEREAIDLEDRRERRRRGSEYS